MSKIANKIGNLKASFVLDKNDMPRFDEDKKGLKHYWIDLAFEPGDAEEAEAVTFFLDEDSYHDPVRLALKKANFTERITSFGDFPVIAQVETDDFHTLSGTLGKLLRRAHPNASTNQALSQALDDITKN